MCIQSDAERRGGEWRFTVIAAVKVSKNQGDQRSETASLGSEAPVATE